MVGDQPLVSDAVGLGKGQKVCVSNTVPIDADAIGLGTTLSQHLV